MLLFGLFALSLGAAFLGWVGLGLIRSSFARALFRSTFIALAATPTIVGGHGVALVPAWFLLGEELGHPLAWIPIGVVWAVILALTLSIRPLRNSRTAWPLDLGQVLLAPPYPKAGFHGVLALLGFAAGYETISDHWPLQVMALVLGGLVNFGICYHAARRFGRAGWVLPLMFAAPIAVSMILVYAIAWWLAGIGGQLVAAQKPHRALWLGAAIFGVLAALAAERTYAALRARDLAHVKIQGGVAGNAGIAIGALVLAGLCLVLIPRARQKSVTG